MIAKIKRGMREKNNFKSNQYKLSQYTYKFVVVEMKDWKCFQLDWLLFKIPKHAC
jgi:hypothetical protein